MLCMLMLRLLERPVLVSKTAKCLEGLKQCCNIAAAKVDCVSNIYNFN